MKLTAKIQKAINLSSRLHYKQNRKGDDNLPYISHPYSVAWILSNYTDDEDVIVAALLHDVLEDVDAYYYKDMERDFGKRVAEIVKGVSEEKDEKDANDETISWQSRKDKYLEILKNSSKESLLIASADKIHNLQSMIDAYQRKGDSFWDNFNSPKDKKLWLYREVLKLVKLKLDSPIVKELETVYSRAEKILL